MVVPERQKRLHRRMQYEKAVKIDDCLAWNVDAGPHGIVLRLGVRHHYIQAVGGTALKDDDQPLFADVCGARAKCDTCQKARYRRRANHSHGAVAKKNSACDGHETNLLRDVAYHVLLPARTDVASYVS